MSNPVIGTAFKALRCLLQNEDLLTGEEKDLLRQNAAQVYTFSSGHDMAHLFGYAFLKYGILKKEDEYGALFEKKQLAAIYRYTTSEMVYGRLCGALEEAKIPFLPLKGIVLRAEYPEPWMRTSSDIDLLVHESDLERAGECFEQKLGFQKNTLSAHDLSFHSPEGVHVELHYELIEEKRANDSSEVLAHVWDHASPSKEGSARYVLDDAMFFFYHIAHMAKHMENGGCGIRPFLDVVFLDKRKDADEKEREKLLKESDLLTFALACRRLSAVWFEGAMHDDTTSALEDFILRGGVYGSTDNRVMATQTKKSLGRIGFILSRIFMPYSMLKYKYPILFKYPILYPFCQIVRWVKFPFSKRIRKTKKELSYTGASSDEERKKTEALFRTLGL